MISSYVGENAEFERQYLSGELEVELTPQVMVYFFAQLKVIKIGLPITKWIKYFTTMRSDMTLNKIVRCWAFSNHSQLEIRLFNWYFSQI